MKSISTGIEQDTAILPDVVADAVVREVERVLAKPIGRKREALVATLVVHADGVYRNNERFRKQIRARGNKGRDTLYVFMRHWLASELKSDPWNLKIKLSDHMFRRLANGEDLTEGLVGGRSGRGASKSDISIGDTLVYTRAHPAYAGREFRGVVVMRGTHGWVVDRWKSADGTPDVVDEARIVRVVRGGKGRMLGRSARATKR